MFKALGKNINSRKNDHWKEKFLIQEDYSTEAIENEGSHPPTQEKAITRKNSRHCGLQ